MQLVSIGGILASGLSLLVGPGILTFSMMGKSMRFSSMLDLRVESGACIKQPSDVLSEVDEQLVIWSILFQLERLLSLWRWPTSLELINPLDEMAARNGVVRVSIHQNMSTVGRGTCRDAPRCDLGTVSPNGVDVIAHPTKSETLIQNPEVPFGKRYGWRCGKR